jgi:two-component sensor histidine kinase/ActR/RegA family two-component response regulator
MSTVMIAEDDLLMADMLSDILVQNGYEVCGIARTVDKAVELGERYKPDLAVLDIGLANGDLGTDIAARLKNIGRMGILYASGRVGQMALTKADGEAILSKPYRTEDIINGLKVVEQIISTDEAKRHCRTGFVVLDDAPRIATAMDTTDAEGTEENRRIRRQQAELARFGLFALAEGDLGNVLAEAACVCAKCFEVPYCTIYQYRNEENDLIAEAGAGWNQGVIGRVVSRAENNSPQGRAFISRAPVTCGDLSKDTTFVQSSLYMDYGIRATLNVVIPSNSHAFMVPYGVLAIDSPVQRRYDSCDTDFLTGIANVLAQTVDSTKRKVALQIAVDRMQDMDADRDRLLAAQSALLEERNRFLDEKSRMARELEYRIRNNLQLVYGMLSKQVRVTKDDVAIDGINAIRRRVLALAQVYDNLLGTGLSGTIDFGKYLSSLCESFEALQNSEYPMVELLCHWKPVSLERDTVTALGLVISELLANSYAHAFPDGRGSISVSLSLGQPGEVATIFFADDGVGFAEKGDSKRNGLRLTKRLMEQVGGSVALRSDSGTEWTHGTEWTLKFPVPVIPSAEQLIPGP